MADQSRWNCVPTDVIFNILLRLTTKDLVQLKYVCRDWRNIIRGKEFIQLHLQHVRNNSKHPNNRLLFSVSVRKSENTSRRCIRLHSAYLDPIIEKREQVKQGLDYECLNLRRVRPECYMIVGSCNGIICLRNAAGFAFTLLNPTTGCHLDIEDSKRISKIGVSYSECWFGFGYECETDDYKVVKVNSICTVYGDGHERKNGTSCNELHWLAQRKGNTGPVVVVSFDLQREEFRLRDIPLPEQGLDHAALVDLNGSLHLTTVKDCEIDIYMDLRFHRTAVWILEDDHWRRLGRIESIRTPAVLPRLISLSEKHNEMVLHHDRGSTQIYLTDLATGTVRATQWASRMLDGISQPYIETLVDLQYHDDVRTDNNAQTSNKRKRKRPTKWKRKRPSKRKRKRPSDQYITSD